MTAAGLLAVRAANQYRRRDVIAYLGLRYYLDNAATRSDRWAREVAPDLVMKSAAPAYLAVPHFKDVTDRGQVAHREIFLPGPNEALAETALLDACAQAGGAFKSPHCVFSYRLASGRDSSGVYQHYMVGLRERQAAIAAACHRAPDAVVVHLDIRRFYPTISIQRAKDAWVSASAESKLKDLWVQLGARLLEHHGDITGGSGGHLLTGPMFSHLVANVMLRQLDGEASELPAQYFRYVDDITLVGTQSDVDRSIELIKRRLGSLELELHGSDSAKSVRISAKRWLDGANDYAEQKGAASWMALVGDLKRLLVSKPDLRGELTGALMDRGIRLPLPDYTSAVAERSYRSRFRELLDTGWFRRVVGRSSVHGVVSQVERLRTTYMAESRMLLEQLSRADAFESKRLLPKIRYRFGRMAYIGERSQLADLGALTDGVQALRFQNVVARSIASGDVSDVAEFGVNATQAVAQPLHAQAGMVGVNRPERLRSSSQSMAVLMLNGIKLPGQMLDGVDSELLRFAKVGADQGLMRSDDAFIRQLACLHGVSDKPKHEGVLETAFDADEEIALDAVAQDHGSS